MPSWQPQFSAYPPLALASAVGAAPVLTCAPQPPLLRCPPRKRARPPQVRLGALSEERQELCRRLASFGGATSSAVSSASAGANVSAYDSTASGCEPSAQAGAFSGALSSGEAAPGPSWAPLEPPQQQLGEQQRRHQRLQEQQQQQMGEEEEEEEEEGEEEEERITQSRVGPMRLDAFTEQSEIVDQMAANTRRTGAIMSLHFEAMLNLLTHAQRARLMGLCFPLPVNVGKCVKALAHLLKLEPDALPPAAQLDLRGEMARWAQAGPAPPRRWVLGSGTIGSGASGGGA